jgi:hypothetical protein
VYHLHLFKKKARQRAGPLSGAKRKKNYFCCSLGLSAGFGGLVWVCCCGVAGVEGFAVSLEAETGTFVIVLSLHEKTKVEVSVLYLDVYRSATNKGECQFIIK